MRRCRYFVRFVFENGLSDTVKFLVAIVDRKSIATPFRDIFIFDWDFDLL